MNSRFRRQKKRSRSRLANSAAKSCYIRTASSLQIEEPAEDRDRFLTYWLTHLGIEKGKRFDRDTCQQDILEEAGFVGESMAQAMVSDERHPKEGEKCVAF